MTRRYGLPMLSDSRLLRLAFFYSFYGAQGVAIGLFTFPSVRGLRPMALL